MSITDYKGEWGAQGESCLERGVLKSTMAEGRFELGPQIHRV